MCVDVIVWVGVGVIAWVREGVCGWTALIAAFKYVHVCVYWGRVGRRESGVRVCVCVCDGVCVCNCVGGCECDCVGEEGSVWVGKP